MGFIKLSQIRVFAHVSPISVVGHRQILHHIAQINAMTLEEFGREVRL